MKFYEITSPYYGLIKANNEKEATNLYIKMVSDTDATYDIKEVSHDYALSKYVKAPIEEGNKLSEKELEDEFNLDSNNVLLIDYDLI